MTHRLPPPDPLASSARVLEADLLTRSRMIFRSSSAKAPAMWNIAHGRRSIHGLMKRDELDSEGSELV
jgi:hypothetical protein